jgi:hypothetical protein
VSPEILLTRSISIQKNISNISLIFLRGNKAHFKLQWKIKKDCEKIEKKDAKNGKKDVQK